MAEGGIGLRRVLVPGLDGTADGGGHRLRGVVEEIGGMIGTYLGQAAETGADDEAAVAHGLEDGNAKALETAGEEEGTGMAVEPALLPVGDLAGEQHPSPALLLDELAQAK